VLPVNEIGVLDSTTSSGITLYDVPTVLREIMSAEHTKMALSKM
jgi:hypothetical protein